MDPALTELLQRTESIEMAMKEIDTNRPYVLGALLGLVVPFLTFLWAGFRWPFQELWTALKEDQAAKNEIHQKLLLIPAEVKKAQETTKAEIRAEIEARSESIDDILKEVRATQTAVSAIELSYEADRLMNERRYEFAVTTLTQLMEALYISLHNHKLIAQSERNFTNNTLNSTNVTLPVLSEETYDSLVAICEAQIPAITSMIARAPIIFDSKILNILNQYLLELDNFQLMPDDWYSRVDYYEEFVSIEAKAYTSLVKESRTVLFRLPENNPPSP